MVAKSKAYDTLWKETGVEEEDITRAFYIYRISECDEFKKILEDARTNMQMKIKEQAEKIQQAMQAQGMRPGMGGMGGPGMGMGGPGMGMGGPGMGMGGPGMAPQGRPAQRPA